MNLNIQWYPGHMTKARRAMQEDLKLVDIVIELADARIPRSSRNPDLRELTRAKKRILILNKADLADPAQNTAWKSRLEAEGETVILTDARGRGALKDIRSALEEASAEKRERDRKRGILNRPIRVMAAGIPNVGKSTLINSLAGKASARTGDKPGVTRGDQWIRISRTLDLLDTPGILWPKFDDPETGLSLALIGSVNDEILPMTEVACASIVRTERLYPGLIGEHYRTGPGSPAEMLEGIARSRSLLKPGGEADTDRAARLLMNDLRKACLGRLTFEQEEEKR